MYRVLVSAFATALLTSPCWAAWQGIEWGTTLDQVLEQNASIRRATDKEAKGKSIKNRGQALAVTNYETSKLSTIGYFLFQEGRLSAVSLELKDRDAAGLAQSLLRDQYGPVAREEKDYSPNTGCTTTLLSWRDAKHGNNVLFRSWDCPDTGKGSYSILYSPILEPAETGL